jgi:regulator of protease activity HflC (stomatin/prohibitin superfamily)
MPHQSVYTKDNMSVFIDTALFFRVTDPYKATYVVKDLVASLMQITFVTLRTICG